MKQFRNTPPHNKFLVIVSVFFTLAFFFLFFHGNYPKRIIDRLNGEVNSETTIIRFSDKALSGWERCLQQLNTHADIVFIGDSITHRSSFNTIFRDKTICNLGMDFDTIQNIIDRASMVQSVHPDKIFLLCGINSLKDGNVEQCLSEYETLVKKLISDNNSDLYIISVLPVSKDVSETLGASKDTIVSFNSGIQKIASSYGIVFIDLYHLLEENGYILPEYAVDGIHLSESGYSTWADAIRPYID